MTVTYTCQTVPGLDRSLDRRQLLSLLGTASVASIAGCGSQEDGSGADGDSNAAESTPEPQHNSELAGFQTTDLALLPIVDDENRTQKATIQADVVDEDGLQSVTVHLDNGTREVEVATKSVSGNSASIDAEFSSQFIAPGENAFEIAVADQRGDEDSFWSDSFTFETPGYRVETKHVSNDNYATERKWDNSGFSQDRINRKRQEWQEAARYDGFLSKVRSDAEFPLISDYPNDQGDGGHFDLHTFKTTDDWEEMLSYITLATVSETLQTHDGPPSAHANEMAASAEKAIEDVRNDKVRAWGVFNPGHGTIMYYNPDEDAERRWYHADTTSNNINHPKDAQSHRPDIWSPFRSPDAPQPGFHTGFDVDEVDGVNTYGQMKKVAVDAIGRMVASGKPSDLRNGRGFITNEWLHDAYQHIREGRKINPIRDSLEEIVDHQVQQGKKYVGIYGGGPDDTHTAAGDQLDDIYSQVMYEPGNVPASEIETYLRGNTDS